jgi:hypothetical protein
LKVACNSVTVSIKENIPQMKLILPSSNKYKIPYMNNGTNLEWNTDAKVEIIVIRKL